MRFLLGLALATFMIVIGLGLKDFPIQANPGQSSDYAQYLWQVHRNERPLPTGIVAQSPPNDDAIEGQMVTYGSLEGKPLKGYQARPAQSSNPLPAMILIHEWWGLNDNIQAMTRKLAAQGYNALAVDLYEGKSASQPEQAKELVMKAQGNPDRLKANITEAYRYLEQQQAPKIGSIGWCFGGTWSLQTALLFPDQLDAAVIYYGGDLETNPERLQSLQMPILGIFGELDSRPSVETVRQFESALKSLNKQVEIHIYPNANHAFANPSGERYNPQAAEDAWEKTQKFLAEHLKSA